MNDSLFSILPSELSSLITALKVLGWAIIFYIVFGIINMIISRKRNKELRQVNLNLVEIKKLLRKKK